MEEIERYVRGLDVMTPGTPGAWYQLGMVREPENELIGDCGFRVFEHEPQQAEIGIALAPGHQGHGYATEAFYALLDYLFVRLGEHRVIGSVDPRNLKSVQLLRRVGMRQEASFRKSLWFKGEWVDDDIYAMLATEWHDHR